MTVDPSFSLSVNLNMIGINIAGIMIGTFCLLAALYYFYIDRDRFIFYVVIYFAFVFLGLFSTFALMLVELGDIDNLSKEAVMTVITLFDYCILFCFLAAFLYLVQRRLHIFLWIMLLLIPILSSFGHYTHNEKPFFYVYLTITIFSCLFFVFIEMKNNSFKENIPLFIGFCFIYVYYIFSYTVTIGNIPFDYFDWIMAIIVVAVSTAHFMIRYKSILNEKEHLYHKLTHDGLTGIYSKNYFLEVLEKTTSGILVFMDINNFKKVNDNYGHLTGDRLLVQFANQLTSIQDATGTWNTPILRDSTGTPAPVNPADSVGMKSASYLPCRFGGDEFVLLIQHSGINETKKIMTKLTDHFEAILIREKIDYQTLGVGISSGISNFTKGKGKAALINADFAMYKSKKEGNNTLTVFHKEAK